MELEGYLQCPQDCILSQVNPILIVILLKSTSF